MLLKDLLEEFILELQIQNYSPRTMKSYRNNNLLMFTFIENKFDLNDIEKIKTVHINKSAYKTVIDHANSIKILDAKQITLTGM